VSSRKEPIPEDLAKPLVSELGGKKRKNKKMEKEGGPRGGNIRRKERRLVVRTTGEVWRQGGEGVKETE